MIKNTLDSVEFKLKGLYDFTWLKKYGKAFWVVDETGSGCIGIGTEKDNKKIFCKIAGVDSVEAEITPEESVELLKNAVSIYYDLEHPNLVKVIDAYEYNLFYVVVFEWLDGECLFDHWNFEKYKNNIMIKSPKKKFQELSNNKKMKAMEAMFSFLQNTNEKGYVAVDFYDGSMMYDFETDKITFFDIDLFKKAPAINDKGVEWFGTKRLKAPEEYQEGCVIDEQTNIFTLGALIFEFFGRYTQEEIDRRYKENRFLPCSFEMWGLNEASYKVVSKAVSFEKTDRYENIVDFHRDWMKACSIYK